MSSIDSSAFVAAITPALQKRDVQQMLEICKANWTADQVVSLLSCDNRDARKVAALALSLAGCQHCLEPLAKALKDRDPMVNQMAEHAMWAIWFRCGSPEANQFVQRGSDLMSRREFDQAIEHFNHAIKISPKFAEAYNQRAIVKYLQERYDESLEDCRQTVSRMPCHFGAWAGMGHCHAHQGRLTKAVEHYEKALAINPAMTGVRQVINELKNEIAD